MNRAIYLAASGILATGAAFADNFTQTNVDRKDAVIEAAVEAYGGAERLAALDTLFIEHEGINYAVQQSRGTEPPWDKSDTSGYSAIDLKNSVFVTQNSFNGGGFEGRNGTIVNGEDSYQLDFRAGTVARLAEPNFDATSGPFVRVTPALLLQTLRERTANAYSLGETSVGGIDYEVIGFSMTVGPAISLFFDKETHLLRRSERMFAGVGLVQYAFEDYEIVDGIPFNSTFKLFVNGDPNLERTVISTKVNEPLARWLTVDANLKSIPEVEPDPLTRQEIADGVWLIGGSGTYGMFVDMGEYVFAAGGTAGASDRIESLREVVGGKPLKYAMLTHHHFDHVMAVPAYVSAGATLITAAEHETIARGAAGDGASLKIKTVGDRMSIEGGGRVVEIIDIGPTAHTEHLLVAYLPEEGVLFEADHFALPAEGPAPPAVSSTQTFAEALARKNLRVKRIVSAHSSRVATMDDLQSALEKEAFQARH